MPAARTSSCSTRIADTLTAAEARAWDHLVNRVDQSDVAQLHGWGRVRSSAGFSPMYVFVESDGVLAAGAQVLVRHVPILGSIGYVSHGPVIADGLANSESVRSEVCRGLLQLTRTRRVRMLFVQPPIGAPDVSVELARLGFRLSDAGIAPTASLRIDLSASEDELRACLQRRLRRWSNRWPERGVTVRVGSDDDLPLLAALLAESAEYQGYEPLSLDYLRRMYGELAPTGNAVLFIGEVGGQPVAADLFTVCGGALRDRLIGFDRSSDASHLHVPGAIKWNAMLWAKRRGLRWFDFGGVRPDLARSLLAGTSLDNETIVGADRFKLTFGGSPYEMPPAVAYSQPKFLLDAYRALVESDTGRRQSDRLKRWLRGGRR